MRPRRVKDGERERWSVRTYLIVIVLAALAAVAGASVYGLVWSAGKARSDALEEMEIQARRASAAISEALATSKQTVDGLAAQPALRDVFARSEDCALVASGGGPFPSVRLDIVGPDGSVPCSSDRSPAVTADGVHAGSAWLDAALRSPEGGIEWDATDAATGRRAVVFTAPLDKADAGAGTIALFLHVPGVGKALANDYAGAERAGFTVVDRADHAVLASSGGRPGGARFPDARTSGEWPGVDGSRRFFSSADVSGSDWRVYAGVLRSTALADVRGAFIRQLLVGLLALLVIIVAAWILNRRVAGPLRALIDAAVRAGREPGGARVGEAGTAELVTLAREFNATLDLRAGHEAQLAHQATHDALTGLPNKSLLGDQLAQALRDARQGRRVAVFCLGVDRLDIVTDGFGHDAGDNVLLEVSERLADAVDEEDLLLSRFGATEFVVLSGDAGDVKSVAERLHACLERPFRGPAADIVLKGAVGVAAVRDGASSPEQLLREADSAMREARRSGRAWLQFDGRMQLRATQHLAVEHDLWQALQREELLVHYQPLLDVATRTIVGAEALVRWEHPERGLVAPLAFIPTAEQTGQIGAIGQFVLTRACGQAAAWAAAGHRLRVSVNVAVTQLHDEDFPMIVEQTLSETGLAPDRLCLEITESSLIREVEQGSAVLTRLKQLGVDLSMDDFGTGYSSLSHLHHLPVDELKVDRSFIGRIDRALRDRHLVEAIIGMAQALDLSVVAEGVETDEQLEFLATLGCELAQGFLFAPAQPADQLLALVPDGDRAGRLAAAG